MTSPATCTICGAKDGKCVLPDACEYKAIKEERQQEINASRSRDAARLADERRPNPNSDTTTLTAARAARRGRLELLARQSQKENGNSTTSVSARHFSQEKS